MGWRLTCFLAVIRQARGLAARLGVPSGAIRRKGHLIFRRPRGSCCYPSRTLDSRVLREGLGELSRPTGAAGRGEVGIQVSTTTAPNTATAIAAASVMCMALMNAARAG